MPKLGTFKIGANTLGSSLNGQVDLIESANITVVTNKTAKNLIEGVVIYRKSQRNFNEYITVNVKTTKTLEETVSIYSRGQNDLTESVFINKYGQLDFIESVNIVLNNISEITEDVNILALGTSLLSESIQINKKIQIDFLEDINVYYASQNDLIENVRIGYKNLKNLDEVITIQANKNTRLTEVVDITFKDIINLIEFVNIDARSANLVETVNIRSDSLQGIYLYKDPEHTQLIENDTQSFTFSFGDCIEEEKIVPFYIVNGLSKSLSNLYISISLNNPKTYYGQDMVFLSINNQNYTTNELLIPTLLPSSGGVFYVRISPKLGINNNHLNSINFRIFKK